MADNIMDEGEQPQSTIVDQNGAMSAHSDLGDKLQEINDRLNQIDLRIRRFERMRKWAAAIPVGIVSTIFSILGFSVYTEVKEGIPPLVEQVAKEAAVEPVKQELKRSIPVIVERQVEQEMEALRPVVERLVRQRVDGAIPVSVKLGWMIEELGGNFTARRGGQIERIDLSNTPITDADLQRLSAHSGVREVNSLLLRNTSITVHGLKPLADWQKLEEVDLSGTYVTKKDAVESLGTSIVIKIE